MTGDEAQRVVQSIAFELSRVAGPFSGVLLNCLVNRLADTFTDIDWDAVCVGVSTAAARKIAGNPDADPKLKEQVARLAAENEAELEGKRRKASGMSN
jgi:hypothetical protein